MLQPARYKGRTRHVRPDQLRPGQMIVAVDGESTAAWPRRRWPTVSQRPWRDRAGRDLVMVVPCDNGGAFYLRPDESVTIAA